MMYETPNIKYIKELSGGEISFEEKMIEIIKKEFPEEVEIYLRNFNSGNYKQAAENVHKLKHKISILGLERSYALAVNYECNLIEEINTLHEEFDNILQIIADYLETL